MKTLCCSGSLKSTERFDTLPRKRLTRLCCGRLQCVVRQRFGGDCEHVQNSLQERARVAAREEVALHRARSCASASPMTRCDLCDDEDALNYCPECSYHFCNLVRAHLLPPLILSCFHRPRSVAAKERVMINMRGRLYAHECPALARLPLTSSLCTPVTVLRGRARRQDTHGPRNTASR